ncbi:MAG: glycosyltransferase family 2 protein [Phocaeicola sp.]
MNTPLVSIIVPVYNAEKYIHECIDSLLAQTYANIEVVLVDDGSPDNCGKICEDYAAKDNRIKVIHQQNAGVSAARNKAIAHSKGERITFVDADDKVTDDYIEKLMSKDGDWGIGGYRDTNNNCCNINEGGYIGKDRLIQFFQEHLHNLYTNNIGGKLYRSSIICKNNIKFNTNVRFSEDFLFNLEYLNHCNSVALIREANYIITPTPCVEEKYKLTLQELSYILEQITERTKALSEKWGTEVKCEKSIRVNIAMYPMSKVFIDSSDYEELYSHYVFGKENASFYDRFYSDNICSPVIRGIRLAKTHIKSGHFIRAIKTIYKVRKAYRAIIPSIPMTRYDRLVALICGFSMRSLWERRRLACGLRKE